MEDLQIRTAGKFTRSNFAKLLSFLSYNFRWRVCLRRVRFLRHTVPKSATSVVIWELEMKTTAKSFGVLVAVS